MSETRAVKCEDMNIPEWKCTMGQNNRQRHRLGTRDSSDDPINYNLKMRLNE